jgi:transglutaminase-like putative cysteine protease
MEREPPSNRLAAWFTQRILPHLLVWVLLAGVAELLGLNFNGAAWVPDSSTLTQAVAWGMLLGVALAGSRFSGRLAAGYHFVMALLLLSLGIGRIVPPLGQILSRPPLETLDLANVRIFTYIDRVAGWAGALAAGNAVQDNGLFQLLIGLILWMACAWLAWAAIRRQRALDGLLPFGLVLGLNTYLSNQSVDALWLFLGCAIMLAPRTALVALHHSWNRRRVDYPDDLGLTWTGAAMGLGLVILLFARLAPVVGTPEGWRELGDALRQAQKQLEGTTNRLFSDVAPPPVHPEDVSKMTTEPPAPFAETPQMGLIGVAPIDSNEVVMWVKTSDLPPPQPGPDMPTGAQPPPGPAHYWRANIFGRYTGKGWEAEAFDPQPGTVELPAPPSGSEALVSGQKPPAIPGHYLLNQSFDIPAHHGPDLFAASQPAAASGGAALRYAGPDATPLVFGGTSHYTVQSWVTQVTDVTLRAAPTRYPADISTAYLQLPTSLPQRVRDLTHRVVGDAATPFDKAVRIQDYLRKSYKYDTRVPPPPAGQDVVDYFLFDSPGGFCSYYSSAMAVMLRIEGVAARVVSGYNTGAFDYSRGAYRVTPSNAHAWPEVYFPGTGWVEFEPTAAIARIDYETPAGQAAATNAPLPERPIPPMPAWQVDLLVGLAVATPIVLFVWVFRMQARRRRQFASQPPALSAVQHYQHLRRLLGWAGLNAPASATPAEYLSASRAALQGYGALSGILEQATALYEQAVYSPSAPERREVEQASRLYGRSWRDWVKLYSKRTLGSAVTGIKSRKHNEPQNTRTM